MVATNGVEKRHKFYVEGEPERIPNSFDDALAEDRELLADLQQIEANLTTAIMNRDADPIWRRRAVDARRHINTRRKFLKDWIHQQKQPQFVNTAIHREDLSDVTTTAMMRVAARRIGQLESVFMASVALLDDDSTENREGWERRVRLALDICPVKEGVLP